MTPKHLRPTGNGPESPLDPIVYSGGPVGSVSGTRTGLAIPNRPPRPHTPSDPPDSSHLDLSPTPHREHSTATGLPPRTPDPKPH